MSSLLYEEHALLGARFAAEGSVPVVASYGHPDAELAGFADSAALVDLSGVATRLIAGVAAPDLCSACFAGVQPEVGECSFQAVLTGDGSVASVGLLARTGDREYLCWDLGDRHQVLFAWLEFLAQIEQGGVTPFAGAEVEDVGEHLVPLMLAGPLAPSILTDYLREQPLPQAGSIASRRLDETPCLVACLPFGAGDAFLVLVPPQMARIFWRSFLSFGAVVPAGAHALLPWLADQLPWFERVAEETDKLTLPAHVLRTWGLVRREPTLDRKSVV